MDKTININIAGTLFQIDDEAFRILRDYLQAINNRFRNAQGGHETVEDIESRIAEIFQSQKGLAGVITKENVEAMISIIGKPEDFDHESGEIIQPVYSSTRKRMYRNPDDSIIGGVCGGLGAYLNTDPVLFRILFVIFTVFFGVGFFVYIILWIALPSAGTDAQKREMYGDSYLSARSNYNRAEGSNNTGSSSYYTSSKLGNAFNEVFRAIGRVFFIIIRISLIIIGVIFVLMGFLAILSFVMVFVFKYPGAFSFDSSGINLIYLPDFLNYIVNPAATPWIIILTSIAFILPMIALIYWGVKMIFWFKVKDGLFSLVILVIWVMSLAALTIIFFNEGISFAQTAKLSSQKIFTHSPDTLYIRADKKVADLKFDKELSLTSEAYTVFINEETKDIYIRPHLNVNTFGDDVTKVEVRRRSAGRTQSDAMKKAEGLLYNYSVTKDTLILDEYFTIPSGRKWSADNVSINLSVPEGTILKFDSASENLLHSNSGFEDDNYSDSKRLNTGNRLWTLTEEGIKPLNRKPAEQK